MTKIEITIDGDPNPITYIEKEKDFINTDIIINILQNLNENKNENEIEFIRYLNTKYDAWVLLKENDDILIKEGFRILVKLKENNFDETQLLKKKEIINKITELNKKIDNELSKLNKQKNKKIEDLRPSRTFNLKNISENEKEKEKETDVSSFVDDDSDDNDLVDIIVLTANPLVENEELIENDSKPRILRTMNDFNSITSSIHNVILNKCNKQIKAQFLPLTGDNLEFAISQKPKILHLICKSVYELENKKYITNLLFEDELCRIDRKNEEDIKKIINSKDLLKIDKDITKNITLFICTPLSEDVFDIFKNINFKNIIVQHTTLANIDFVSELNEQLYLNILELNKSIIDAFEVAKKNSINIPHQFCCCFHKHKDNCKLKMNLSNELYFDCEVKEDIFKIPHFYHLRYKCECTTVNKSFCEHNKKVCDNYNYGFKPLYNKKSKKQNLCCCDLKIEHNLNHIFFCKFSETKDEEGIFSNYQNNNFCKIINRKFVPNYNKMILLVGKNKIVYNIFDLLKDKNENIINIYGKEYKESINKVDQLIDMIIEFLKERIPYNFRDDNPLNLNNENYSLDLSLSRKNTNNFKMNKYERIKEKLSGYDSDLNLIPTESAPQVINKMSLIPKYQKIYFYVDEQENIISIINYKKNSKNKIYFINGFKISYDDIIKIFDKNNLYEAQIVVFTEKQLKSEALKNSEKYKIYNLEFEHLKKEDYEVSLQNIKVLSQKETFDSKIKHIEYSFEQKSIELEKSITIVKDENKSNLNYELLFLFNCSNSGLFGMEIESLYQKNINEINSIIEKKYIPIRVIKKEVVPKYYRYQNTNLFKEYYDTRDNIIPNKVKILLLEKLFNFYAKAFRLLLKTIKIEQYDKEKLKTNLKVKKYKPNESLTSFSAIQELGMWLPFENKENDELNKLKIINIDGYFKHLLRNFKDTFKEENIRLCSKNKEVWNNVKENIEDISITLPTFIKMFSLNENRLITLFEETLKNRDHFTNPSYLRFKLFDYMNYEYSNIKKDILNKLEGIEKEFRDIGYIQGELETLFAKCIVNYREKADWKTFDDIYKNQIMVKLIELKYNNYSIDNKEKFIILFQSKVRYKYIKYKIKLGLLIKEELLELEQVVLDFIKAKNIFYIIKTCFLISEWHLRKKNYANLNGLEEESDKELKEYFNYLNFAYYISIIYDKNYIYTNYSKNFIRKKFNITQLKDGSEQVKEIREKLIELCTKYKIKIYKDKINKQKFYVD